MAVLLLLLLQDFLLKEFDHPIDYDLEAALPRLKSWGLVHDNNQVCVRCEAQFIDRSACVPKSQLHLLSVLPNNPSLLLGCVCIPHFCKLCPVSCLTSFRGPVLRPCSRPYPPKCTHTHAHPL